MRAADLRPKVVQNMDFFTEYDEGNRYQVQEMVGKGSYGVVCSAIDTQTGQKVAIKKITNIFEHVSDATRILREIKLLRLLRHPDIVEIKHIMLPPSCREFKDIYVVFELMESDLHQVIKANDDLTPQHYQFFLYQLLRAMKYIHTDCLLQYTPAVDIWSIGCIFAEVLSGRPLFPGKNVVHQLDLMTDVLGTPSTDAIARILEYHPHMLKDQLLGTDNIHFMYPSAVNHFKKQFNHLEENYNKGHPCKPLDREHSSLPRARLPYSRGEAIKCSRGTEKQEQGLRDIMKAPPRPSYTSFQGGQAKPGRVIGPGFLARCSGSEEESHPRRLAKSSCVGGSLHSIPAQTYSRRIPSVNAERNGRNEEFSSEASNIMRTRPNVNGHGLPHRGC